MNSGWKRARVDISESTTLSEEVDLGKQFSKLMVLIPTITSSTVTVEIAKESGGTYYPLYEHKHEATGDSASITTGATTAHAVSFDIGGAQFVKILCGTAQETTDKDFYVQGYD